MEQGTAVEKCFRSAPERISLLEFHTGLAVAQAWEVPRLHAPFHGGSRTFHRSNPAAE